VKIIRTDDKLVLQLGGRERNLFFELLKLYPCITKPDPLKSAAQMPESSERLLDEALAEQRNENKKQVEAFLADPRRFEKTAAGWRFSLSTVELEWLLQVLNDVRVGSWIRLGSPEEKLEMNLLNEKTAPHFWAMEMAGHFQMGLLEALND
jgi:hypothetical protein